MRMRNANAMRMRFVSGVYVRMRCECEFEFALPALLCACATITSVVCHSVSRFQFIVTSNQTLKMTNLRDSPGVRVDFHIANQEGGSSWGRFRFAFLRS